MSPKVILFGLKYTYALLAIPRAARAARAFYDGERVAKLERERARTRQFSYS